MSEESSGDDFAERTKFQYLTHIIGGVLEDESWSYLSLFLFLIDSLFDDLMKFDDVLMVEFAEEFGFFFEDVFQDLGWVGIVFGGEFNGIVNVIKMGQLNSR